MICRSSAHGRQVLCSCSRWHNPFRAFVVKSTGFVGNSSNIGVSMLLDSAEYLLIRPSIT